MDELSQRRYDINHQIASLFQSLIVEESNIEWNKEFIQSILQGFQDNWSEIRYDTFKLINKTLQLNLKNSKCQQLLHCLFIIQFDILLNVSKGKLSIMWQQLHGLILSILICIQNIDIIESQVFELLNIVLSLLSFSQEPIRNASRQCVVALFQKSSDESQINLIIDWIEQIESKCQDNSNDNPTESSFIIVGLLECISDSYQLISISQLYDEKLKHCIVVAMTHESYLVRQAACNVMELILTHNMTYLSSLTDQLSNFYSQIFSWQLMESYLIVANIIISKIVKQVVQNYPIDGVSLDEELQNFIKILIKILPMTLTHKQFELRRVSNQLIVPLSLAMIIMHIHIDIIQQYDDYNPTYFILIREICKSIHLLSHNSWILEIKGVLQEDDYKHEVFTLMNIYSEDAISKINLELKVYVERIKSSIQDMANWTSKTSLDYLLMTLSIASVIQYYHFTYDLSQDWIQEVYSLQCNLWLSYLDVTLSSLIINSNTLQIFSSLQNIIYYPIKELQHIESKQSMNEKLCYEVITYTSHNKNMLDVTSIKLSFTFCSWIYFSQYWKVTTQKVLLELLNCLFLSIQRVCISNDEELHISCDLLSICIKCFSFLKEFVIYFEIMNKLIQLLVENSNNEVWKLQIQLNDMIDYKEKLRNEIILRNSMESIVLDNLATIDSKSDDFSDWDEESDDSILKTPKEQVTEDLELYLRQIESFISLMN